MNPRTALATALLCALMPAHAEKYLDCSPAYQQGFGKIAFLAGDWRAQNFRPSRAADGDIEWVKGEITTRRLMTVFDGAALVDQEGPDTTAKLSSLRFQGLYSYDQFQNKYRFIYTDDNTGLLDVYEGGFVDGNLVLSNVEGGTYWQNGEQRFHGRVVFSLMPPDRFDVVFQTSRDGGKRWLLASRIEHYRIKADDPTSRL